MSDLPAGLPSNRVSFPLRFAVLAFAATSLTAQSFDWSRQPPATSPAARSGHAMAYHESTSRVVLFGGQGADLLFDTWLWSAGVWTEAAVATTPTARRSHAMAYDDLAQAVVMFGGLTPGGQIADTWLWNGQDWQQAFPQSSPSARTGHAMAYDEVRQRVVLFGGTSGGVQLDDTWEWDGTNWTQIASTSNPVPRVGHAMSYDEVRQRVVLFGGSNSGLGALADTWEWTGSNWQPRISANFPPARSGHAMAFDPTMASTVVFGGNAGINADDTWAWDGTDWTQLLPVLGEPAPRTESSLVFAAADNQLIFFGGDNGGSLPDTWTAGSVTSTYGAGCGTPALTFAPGAGPAIGLSIDGTISNVPSNFGAVMLGIDREFFGAFPLPLPLDSFGLTGCDLLQSAEIFGLPVSNAGPGTQQFQVSIPNAQGLVGRHIYGQAFAFAPGQNAAEIIVSNGVDWLLRCPPLPPTSIVEDFDSPALLDVFSSAGNWFGGFGTFHEIGGDARHGDFDLSIATDTGTILDGRAVYEIDCDNTFIPASRTTTGTAVTVTDGRFFFGSMAVPAHVHLRFVGSNPPVLTVAGELDVAGVLDVSAADVGFHTSAAPLGQPGGAPGAFGGAGGKGGDKCLGFGPGNGEYDGADGQPTSVFAGHAYAASSAPTAGRGSQLYPASGLNSSQQFGSNPTVGLMYCLSAVAGGGGGGLRTGGQPGMVVDILDGTTSLPNAASFMGPASPASSAMQVLPYVSGPLPSSQHFLIGGAGGGGAASNATLSLNLARSWASGSAGAGGGGAIGLRAGQRVRIHGSARILAMGGNAADYVGQSAGAQTAPGGGGSGGSILIQSRFPTFSPGEINVSGGRGGNFDRRGGAGLFPQGGTVLIKGGDGGDGYIRHESSFPTSPNGFPGSVPAMNSQNLGILSEVDDTVSVRSLFYSTGLVCSPKFTSYELEAVVNGAAMTFSDDPSISPLMAVFGSPVRVFFQAATMNLVTGETEIVGPWRDSVRSVPGKSGIEVDGGNAYRFMVVFDRTLASSLTIDRLTVTYEN